MEITKQQMKTTQILFLEQIETEILTIEIIELIQDHLGLEIWIF